MKLQALTAALALAGVAGTAARPQTFRSGVDLVRVDALVTDGHRVIPGLSAGDFELRDNGILQIIDGIALESLPLSVTFVLDTSGSVAGAKMRHLASAVDLILKGLREQDRAALVTFSHRVWLRTALTSDLLRVSRRSNCRRAANIVRAADLIINENCHAAEEEDQRGARQALRERLRCVRPALRGQLPDVGADRGVPVHLRRDGGCACRAGWLQRLSGLARAHGARLTVHCGRRCDRSRVRMVWRPDPPYNRLNLSEPESAVRLFSSANAQQPVKCGAL